MTQTLLIISIMFLCFSAMATALKNDAKYIMLLFFVLSLACYFFSLVKDYIDMLIGIL